MATLPLWVAIVRLGLHSLSGGTSLMHRSSRWHRCAWGRAPLASAPGLDGALLPSLLTFPVGPNGFTQAFGRLQHSLTEGAVAIRAVEWTAVALPVAVDPVGPESMDLAAGALRDTAEGHLVAQDGLTVDLDTDQDFSCL